MFKLTKKILIIILVLTMPKSITFSKNLIQTTDLKLWYDEPAEYFINALLLGNGRLGAVVYGRPEVETINLNEETFWSGGPVDLNPNPDAKYYIDPVRKALNDRNYALADKLSRQMQGYFSQSYVPVGDLIIKQDLKGEVKNYYRELDILKAISFTRFQSGNSLFTREVFVSAPAQLIVINFKLTVKGALNLKISMANKIRATTIAEGKELVMSGRAPSHADPVYMNTTDTPIQWESDCKGMRMQTRIKSIENDGQEQIDNTTISIKNASNVTLVVSIATSFNGFDKCPVSNGKDEVALVKSYLSNANKKSFSKLKSEHISDYQQYFNRLDFRLASDPELSKLPTDERLQVYNKTFKDNGLETLLFQYGRYLLISSSRKNGVPANLQGIWNVDLRPAWSSNYTTNINLEMNYWAAEKTGLGDMHEPMIQQIINMSKTGKYIAKNMYGMPGWVAGHNSDLWALTNPVGHLGKGDPVWANRIMAAPWLSQHLWEKYQYRGDKNYLRNDAYPVMKSAAEFCMAWLTEDQNGKLITSPSTSPENRFIGEDGKAWAVTRGSTMDIALIRDLFKNTIEASEIISADEDFRTKLKIHF
jgi:alpha-L-fucosidase 2